MKIPLAPRRGFLLLVFCSLLLGAAGCAEFELPPEPTREGLHRALLRYERLIRARNWPDLLDEAYLPFAREEVEGLWEGKFARWLLSHLVGERALKASWGLTLKGEERNWQEVVDGLRAFELAILAFRRGPPLADFEATYYVHYRLSVGHAKFAKALRAEGVMQWGYYKKTGRWIRLVPVPGDQSGPLRGRSHQAPFPLPAGREG